MYAWLIAHNLGIFFIIAPLALFTWMVMTIEDKIHEIWMEKKIMEDVEKLHKKA